MKQAIIDIGSNSMRLTVYEITGTSFKTLFREKVMAGLAGYVEDGALSEDGIACAAAGLLTFREILNSLNIENCTVFATASLRNIRNTEQAVATIEQVSGFAVEVISGEEEALFGYTGAMHEVSLSSGAFVDVGGASTEIVPFNPLGIIAKTSYRVGSLKLYRDCVKNILPGEKSVKRIQKALDEELGKDHFPFEKKPTLVCAGGTSRAVLKLAKRVYRLPPECRSVSAEQLYGLCAQLCRGGKEEADLILRLEPDRIHTMVPGILILQHICRLFEAQELIVCKYGVREGYLCNRILNEKSMSTPRIGN